MKIYDVKGYNVIRIMKDYAKFKPQNRLPKTDSLDCTTKMVLMFFCGLTWGLFIGALIWGID